MCDLPRPGVEPVSPALACGFLTAGPAGKTLLLFHHFSRPVEITGFLRSSSTDRELTEGGLWLLRLGVPTPGGPGPHRCLKKHL